MTPINNNQTIETPISFDRQLFQTRERVRRLRSQTGRLQRLESLIISLERLEKDSQSLSCLFSDVIQYDLTGLSDFLETESQETGDRQVWPETAVLIDLLDSKTRDLRESLSDFVSFMSSEETRLSFLFSETADHIVMSSIMETETPDPDHNGDIT